MKNEYKDVVKFSRLLYKDLINYVIEFEVNGELKLWYVVGVYSGYEKPDEFNEVLSDSCILQKQTDLSYLFMSSPITHFEKNLPNVKDTSNMFEDCIDLIYFKSKMPNVKYTNYMFEDCSDEFFKLHPHLRDL